jgi:Ras-related protein Rab-1A
MLFCESVSSSTNGTRSQCVQNQPPTNNPFQSLMHHLSSLQTASNNEENEDLRHGSYFDSIIQCNQGVNIPLHVFIHVLSFLEVPTPLIHLLLVCKKWSQMLDDDSVWKQIFQFYMEQHCTINHHSLFSESVRYESSLPLFVKSWKTLLMTRLKYDRAYKWCSCQNPVALLDENVLNHIAGEKLHVPDVSISSSSPATTCTSAAIVNENTEKKSLVSKVCIVGKASCGKSCLLQRWMTGKYEPKSVKRTLTCNILLQQVKPQMDRVLAAPAPVQYIEIVDTAGEERYERFIFTHLKTAHLLVLTFDLSQEDSFNCIDQGGRLYNLIQQQPGTSGKLSSEVLRIVIGLKSDLKKDNTLSYRALQFCTTHRLPYFECSATLEESARDINNIIAYFAAEAFKVQKGQQLHQKE